MLILFLYYYVILDSDTEDHDSCLQNADFSDQTLQLADLDPLKPG